MAKLNKIEARTLHVALRQVFTFVGDSQFRTYRQARTTLNRLVRLGLLKREDHDPNMYVATPLAREAAAFPNVPLDEVRAWMAT